MQKIRFLSTFLSISLVVVTGAAAQDGSDAYPIKPITFVIPSVASGTSDIEARVQIAKLTELTGWKSVFDYRPGAGSTVGSGYVAKAAPDGYILLATTSSFATAPPLYKNVSYDPVRDFAPVSLMTKRGGLLVTHASMPTKSFAEYVAYVRANPGKVNFGTSGAGGAIHLGGEWLHQMIDGKATFVHYKGAGQMLVDFSAGRIDASLGVLAVLALVKTGKIRVIGATSLTRSKLIPDVPTVAEQGWPNYEWAGWMGYFAPQRTPPAIVNKISTQFSRVARSPELIEKYASDGAEFIGSTPDQFREFVTIEVNRWRKVIQAAGIQPQE